MHRSVTDYVIDILVILVIFRQIRPRELTLHTAVLPLLLMVAAGIIYLRPVTLRGHDLALIVLLGGPSRRCWPGWACCRSAG